MYLKDILKFVRYFTPDDIGGIGDPDRSVMNQDDGDDKDDKETEDKDGEEDPEKITESDTDDEPDTETNEDNEDDETNEEEEESEEEDEDTEQEELDTVGIKELKEKYPKLLKEFPEVRAALYRDQQYAEIVGTPNQAKELVSRNEVLTNIERDLFEKNDPSELLNTLKKENTDAYTTVTYNLINHIKSTDKDLYYEIAALPIKELLRSAFRAGNGKEGDLGRAALYIHKYFFNDTNLDEKVKAETGVKTKEKSKEQIDYEKKLEDLDNRDSVNFKNSIDNTYVNRMSNVIREVLDKDERIGDYMKRKITDDVLVEIRNQLNNDKRYLSQMQGLFNQAKANGFTGDFKSRIITAALARAKSIMPAIRSKVVSTALGKSKQRQENEPRTEKKVIRSSGRSQNRDSERRDRNARSTQKTDLDVIRG